jgi:hypothetical protein
MERVVPGHVWLLGEGQQRAEWAALRTEFWEHVDLKLYEIATIRQWREIDEHGRRVILHMEANVLGSVGPGSFRLGPVSSDV